MIRISHTWPCALILSAVVISSCGAQELSSDTQVSINADGAIEAIRDYHAAWEALDFAEVASFHTEDFEYLFFTDVEEADAFPTILSEFWMAGVIEYEVNEGAFRVLIIEPNHAHVTLQVDDRSVYQDGSVARTTGSMTYLLRRDDEWKIRRLHHAGPPPDDLYESEGSE